MIEWHDRREYAFLPNEQIEAMNRLWELAASLRVMKAYLTNCVCVVGDGLCLMGSKEFLNPASAARLTEMIRKDQEHYGRK